MWDDYTLNTSINEPKADEETIDEKLSNRLQRPYEVGIPELRLKFKNKQNKGRDFIREAAK